MGRDAVDFSNAAMQEESLSDQIPSLDLRLAEHHVFLAARAASLLSLGLPAVSKLTYGCSFGFCIP
jgi:hypothetical protein